MEKLLHQSLHTLSRSGLSLLNQRCYKVACCLVEIHSILHYGVSIHLLGWANGHKAEDFLCHTLDSSLVCGGNGINNSNHIERVKAQYHTSSKTGFDHRVGYLSYA